MGPAGILQPCVPRRCVCRTGPPQFVKLAELSTATCQAQAQAEPYTELGPQCPLLARKFLVDTAQVLAPSCWQPSQDRRAVPRLHAYCQGEVSSTGCWLQAWRAVLAQLCRNAGALHAQAVHQLVMDCKSRLRIAVLEDCTEGAERRLAGVADALGLETSEGAAGGRALLGQPDAAWPGLAEGLSRMGPGALEQLWQGQPLEGLNASWHWQ